MMETKLCGPRVISPFREESGDEELSVLPRHTKVIVTGNNRTKSVLVGLQGVVKKAVGLGGWHWLVLKNGIEVKLQRNALSVLEPPTGNEEDDLDNSSSSSDLVDKDHDFASSMDINKLSKPRIRHARTWESSGLVKTNNRNAYKEFQSSIHTPQGATKKVNLGKLGSNSLWRYWRRFHLGRQNSCSSKEQMVGIVERHFATQKVDEVQVIMDFIHRAKKLKKMEQNRE